MIVYDRNKKKIAATFESAPISIATSIIVTVFFETYNNRHKLNFEFVGVLIIMNDTLESLQNDINVFKKNIARVYKSPHYDTDV